MAVLARNQYCCKVLLGKTIRLEYSTKCMRGRLDIGSQLVVWEAFPSLESVLLGRVPLRNQHTSHPDTTLIPVTLIFRGGD